MSEINVKLGLDASGLQKGVQTAKSAINGLAVAATIAAGVGAAVRGMYSAMEAGGALVDLSARTGVAIDKLMVLEMAFKQAGMGAEDVGPAVAKLQKSIAAASQGNAEAASKFVKLGVSLNDIQNLSPDEQFAKIGDAIGKIGNPTERAAAAMDVFGKSGAKLLSVFSAGGMQDIEQNIGGQAKLMLENAGYFDRITDVLGTAGSKLQGLFVGMASQIVPPILFAVEELNKMDLSNVGLSLGSGLKAAIEAFEWWFDNFSVAGGDTLWTTMKLQGAMWINEMANGLRSVFGMKMTELIDTQPLIDKLEANQSKISDQKIERDKQKAVLIEKYALPEVGITSPMQPLAASSTQAIGASLAQIGGGGNIFGGGIGGGDPALSIAREQLSVQEEIKRGILQMTNYFMTPMSMAPVPAVAQ